MTSSKHADTKPWTGGGYRNTLPWRVYDGVAHAVDRAVGWDRLPKVLGLAVLVGVRNVLRRHNLQLNASERDGRPPHHAQPSACTQSSLDPPDSFEQIGRRDQVSELQRIPQRR